MAYPPSYVKAKQTIKSLSLYATAVSLGYPKEMVKELHCFCILLVPYRDSVLTKLLKDAVGGNSKTVMVMYFNLLSDFRKLSRYLFIYFGIFS